MLGEVPTRGVVQESDAGALQKSLLGVDRRCCNTRKLVWFKLNLCHRALRFLNADHEMRRIFGSRVVRERAG